MLLIRKTVGHSMKPTITNGQILIFRKTNKFGINQIVLAQTSTGEIVKRLVSINSQGVYLQGDSHLSAVYFVPWLSLKAVLLCKFV